ncbi:MAG: amidase [Candidatus Rokuibacteriota bacterium]|nr:MAG: amidase [Candidatus Rokubacteria bacterium]
MNDTDLCWMSAADLAVAIAKKKVSPVEVVDATLARIDKLKELNAYVTLDADGARTAAKAAERAVGRRGARLGPLHGVPFSVKDLIITKGIRTTFGTPLYRDNVPAENAPSVARMRAAGAIMLGKTNTPTLGWVGVTDNLLFGVTRNPWSLGHTPGGSSGGAGAAVAAGLAPLAIGTDGGGSIRKPAAWCGIFGLKASWGRIPVYPHGAAWSLSHAGPMTRTVKDAALMMNACAGPDERDQYSLPATDVDYVKALKGSLKGLRVAWSETLGIAPAVDPEVRDATAKAARAFGELGCRVESVEPKWPSPYDCWRTIFLGGIAARLASYLDRRDQIDPGLLPIVEEATKYPPTKYVEAWFERLAWWQHAREFFERYDLLLTPTVACSPLPIGEFYTTEIGGMPVGREAASVFTFIFNMTGQPAATVPCGFTKAGLPIGLQIIGRRFDDVTVLRASAAFEAARPWAQRRPAIG